MTKTMKTFRRITVRFYDKEGLDKFSDKLFKDTEYKLLHNTRRVHLSDDGFDIETKRTTKEKIKPQKEWEKHWVNLPDFLSKLKLCYATIEFHISDDYDNERLSELFDQTITIKTKSIFYPIKISDNDNMVRFLGERGNPQYPIYVISKGRSRTCVTADHLIKMEIPFRIVIEKSEWDDYKAVYDENLLLELDLSFRDEYDTYIKDFDSTKSKGSGPARNFVWHHAKNVMKSEFHWIMDDNIFGFNYFLDQRRVKASDGTLFAAAEDFINRYDNIAIAGLNYYSFVIPGNKECPYVPNTKIYSCLLINNNLPFRWAGRYNEDVDICIRALKEGYSTIQFDAFTAKKGATQTMGGGNTDAFYAEEGTLPKSNMLMFNHPDITNVTWRFQRWHHITNYDVFDYYKDRTIADCIKTLNQPPLLSKDSPIINEIQKINFAEIEDWDILESVEPKLRNDILDVMKFYRYKKDTDFVINELTKEPVLSCDIYNELLGADVPLTVNNKIMKELLALGDVLTHSIDDSIMSAIPDEKRSAVIHELQRNKYLFKKEQKQYTYNLKEVILNELEHKEHHDSKAYLLNKYINDNTNLIVPLTNFDRKRRGELSSTNCTKSFSKQLTARYDTIVKDEDTYAVFVHGCPEFSNKQLFRKEIAAKIELIEKDHNINEFITSVFTQVDLFGANYALSNKLKTKELVPDELSHGKNANRKVYENAAVCSDCCILFINKRTPDIEYLLELFKDKPTYIINDSKTQTLQDW